MATWVELRVHGVSGTPPEAMLGSDRVRQVAGDDRSRAFRPTDGQGREVRPPDGHVLEAFHWGRWTSGSWTQALWLLLIPFGIVNAAQFMLPEPTGPFSRLAHIVCGAALRLLALVLTVLFAVGAAVVALDLGAWQWLGRRDVPLSDQWLLVLGVVGTAVLVFLLSWIGRTSRGAHYRFGRSDVDPEGEDRELPGLRSAAFFDGDPDAPTLRALHRAAGLSVVGWLGLSAVAALGHGWAASARWWALAVVVVTTVVVVLLGDPESTTTIGMPEPRAAWRRGMSSAFRAFRRFWHGWAEPTSPRPVSLPARLHWTFTRLGMSWAVGWLLLLGAVACLVVACVGLLASAVPAGGLVAVSPTLPGMDETAAVVGIAGTVAVVVLMLTVAGLALITRGHNSPTLDGRRLRPFRRFAWGMTPALASAVGFFLGIGLTAGLSLSVQGTLNRLRDDTADRIQPVLRRTVENAVADGQPAPPGGVDAFFGRYWAGGTPPVEAPAVLQRISYAWGITAGLLVVLALLAVGWNALNARTFRARAATAATFGIGGRPRLPVRWVTRVGSAMQLARLKNHLPSVFWVFSGMGALLAIATTIGYVESSGWIAERAPRMGDLVRRFDDVLGGWWRPFTGVTTPPGDPVGWPDVVIGIGQATLLGLAGGAVLLARGAIRAEGARRGLNVVWDVIAFWPRSVHPFVPPPYAQEVVPALVRRICWHLGVPDPLRDTTATSGPEAPEERNPDPAATVVVAAHSQGSLISLAALLWLPEEARDRVRWVTFGSQLRQQFPRAFPHYVRVESLRYAQLRHGWLSLYRDTDPIAGPVTSWGHSWDGVPTSHRLEGPAGPVPDEVVVATGRRVCGREWRLLDPVPDDLALQRRPAAAIRGHSDYWLDADWDDALADVRSWVPGVSRAPAAPPAAG
jgi:hypothetical protein